MSFHCQNKTFLQKTGYFLQKTAHPHQKIRRFLPQNAVFLLIQFYIFRRKGILCVRKCHVFWRTWYSGEKLSWTETKMDLACWAEMDKGEIVCTGNPVGKGLRWSEMQKDGEFLGCTQLYRKVACWCATPAFWLPPKPPNIALRLLLYKNWQQIRAAWGNSRRTSLPPDKEVTLWP